MHKAPKISVYHPAPLIHLCRPGNKTGQFRKERGTNWSSSAQSWNQENSAAGIQDIKQRASPLKGSRMFRGHIF
ncbi:hypothetical protein SRHO_G00314850 [Serrasalmus rhombeus]